jgi:hypothetical protein
MYEYEEQSLWDYMVTAFRERSNNPLPKNTRIGGIDLGPGEIHEMPPSALHSVIQTLKDKCIDALVVDSLGMISARSIVDTQNFTLCRPSSELELLGLFEHLSLQLDSTIEENVTFTNKKPYSPQVIILVSVQSMISASIERYLKKLVVLCNTVALVWRM